MDTKDTGVVAESKPQDPNTKPEPRTNTTFHFKAYSPFKVYYDGEVSSVSAINDTGPFDILARHHNFVTLLNPCDMVIRAVNKDDEVIKITRGIMQVKADDVVVFLDV